jgi:hypothetical protein
MQLVMNSPRPLRKACSEMSVTAGRPALRRGRRELLDGGGACGMLPTYLQEDVDEWKGHHQQDVRDRHADQELGVGRRCLRLRVSLGHLCCNGHVCGPPPRNLCLLTGQHPHPQHDALNYCDDHTPFAAVLQASQLTRRVRTVGQGLANYGQQADVATA